MRRASRLAAALLVLAPAVGWVIATAARGDAATDPTQFAISGDSAPEFTVRQLSLDAYNAGVIGALSPTYSVGLGEDSARADLASDGADLAALSEPLTSSEQSTAQQNGVTAAYMPYGLGAVSVIVALTCRTATGPVNITHLNLKLSTLVKIFAHVIEHWQEPEVLAENPDQQDCLKNVATPNKITLVVRRDPAPTTAALISAFLADPDARTQWNQYITTLGEGDEFKPDTVYDVWPTDPSLATIGETGGDNAVIDGVLDLDAHGQPSPGASVLNEIGYVEPEWAIHYAAVQVGLATGRQTSYTTAVQGTLNGPLATGNITAAFASPGVTFDGQSGLWAIDYSKLTNANAYPVPMPAYFAYPTKGEDPAKVSALSGYMKFVVSDPGQQDVAATGMAPLPAAALSAATAMANAVSPPTAGSIAVSGGAATTTTAGPGGSSVSTSTTVAAQSTASTTSTTTAAGAGGDPGSAGASQAAATGSGVTPSVLLPVTGTAIEWGAVLGVALLVVGEGVRRRSLRKRTT